MLQFAPEYVLWSSSRRPLSIFASVIRSLDTDILLFCSACASGYTRLAFYSRFLRRPSSRSCRLRPLPPVCPASSTGILERLLCEDPDQKTPRNFRRTRGSPLGSRPSSAVRPTSIAPAEARSAASTLCERSLIDRSHFLIYSSIRGLAARAGQPEEDLSL